MMLAHTVFVEDVECFHPALFFSQCHAILSMQLQHAHMPVHKPHVHYLAARHPHPLIPQVALV